MTAFLTFVLSNFSLSFLVIGLVAGAVSAWYGGEPRTKEMVADRLLWGFLLFTLGIAYLYNAVMHTMFAEMAAGFIGWANSPFQYEVGYASLGFGVVAILARKSTFEFRLAAILGPAMFSLGAAGGHLYQMITAHNFAPGNAGVVFWTDIFIPVIGFVLLRLAHPDRGCCRSRDAVAGHVE